MPVKKNIPGGGGGSRHDSFRYENTPPDEPWNGWLAGEPVWIKGHVGKTPTKICVRWATDGKIPCARCGPRSHVEDVGYVPVYRDPTGAPILVMVYDTSYDFLQRCKPLDYVRVVREGAHTERVVVQKALKQVKYVTTLKRRQSGVDISEQLVRLWGINEYTEWYSCQPGNKPVVAGPTIVPVTTAPVTEIVEEIGVPIDATESEVLAAQRDRLRRLGEAYDKGTAEQRRLSNGKHPPKQ